MRLNLRNKIGIALAGLGLLGLLAGKTATWHYQNKITQAVAINNRGQNRLNQEKENLDRILERRDVALISYLEALDSTKEEAEEKHKIYNDLHNKYVEQNLIFQDIGEKQLEETVDCINYILKNKKRIKDSNRASEYGSAGFIVGLALACQRKRRRGEAVEIPEDYSI